MDGWRGRYWTVFELTRPAPQSPPPSGLHPGGECGEWSVFLGEGGEMQTGDDAADLKEIVVDSPSPGRLWPNETLNIGSLSILLFNLCSRLPKCQSALRIINISEGSISLM